MTTQYQTLLKGGHVIDPATSIDGVMDVAVSDGLIAAVEKDIPANAGSEVIDVRDCLVLPGMIDTHAHVYQHVSGRFGLNADMVGVRSGVTTLVDQGGPSCMTFPGFRHFIAEPSDSRVLAFISAYVVGGLEGHYYPDLYGPAGVDVRQTVRVAEANRDLIKGIKAHAEIGGFQRWGIEVIRLSKEISRALEIPVYLHFGQLWPTPDKPSEQWDADAILPAVVDLLDPGDVLAHPFTRHPGGFVDRDGDVHPAVADALARGIKTDVGHGSHFSLDIARRALDAGILPDTLGADMHGYNTVVPAPLGSPEAHPDEEHMFAGTENFSLTFAMTELLALGVPLEKIVPMVTTHCAELLGMDGEVGTLKPGAVADVSVLNDERGQWVLKDNTGASVTTGRMLTPAFCLSAGRRFDADAPILPIPVAA
jgi:dihydroorotase